MSWSDKNLEFVLDFFNAFTTSIGWFLFLNFLPFEQFALRKPVFHFRTIDVIWIHSSQSSGSISKWSNVVNRVRIITSNLYQFSDLSELIKVVYTDQSSIQCPHRELSWNVRNLWLNINHRVTIVTPYVKGDHLMTTNEHHRLIKNRISNIFLSFPLIKLWRKNFCIRTQSIESKIWKYSRICNVQNQKYRKSAPNILIFLALF